MNMNLLTEHGMPLVFMAALMTGYVIKKSVRPIPNRYIPCILAVMGMILGCVSNHAVTLENMVYGMFSGLASTGFHQMFKEMVENGGKINDL